MYKRQINNKEKRIEYTLQMDQSDYQNRETYILSKALAAKLEELSTGIVTNKDQAIFLEGENQNIFYTYQDTINSLLITGEKDTIDKKILPSTRSVYDITEKIAFPKTRKARLSTEIDSNILPWTVYETQTDKPWCQYYTYAAVINNQAGKEITSAKKIIDGTYPQATDEQKEDTSWIISNSVNESMNYVNKTFDKDLKRTPGLLSFDKVKAEIDNHRPVITNLKSDTTEAHSIVQMGYTAVQGNPSLKPFYHYWNPWWEDTFVVSSNSPYIFLGEDKYEWYYTMYNFQEMKPAVSYSSFVQDKRWLPTVENGQLSGTTGLGLRVEAIKINVSGLASGISGGIAYSTHVQDIGWQPEVSNGQMAGTNGKKLRVEAIKIRLTGDLSKKYSVQYRTHVQDIGWTAYSKDNQMSGTSGKKLRIEALEIKLVKK
uniref:Uncharacterized protein n=1 Tax=Candidatus Enterococcus dunnyi TaxID=1834192 RepID=A0A200J0H3_9ENTE|nr:hypothetical protein A5889_002627 [Enterococcus sp. 9D6_DIV0238]